MDKRSHLTRSQRRKLDRKHNFPNGYVEDWFSSPNASDSEIVPVISAPVQFHPVSCILSTQNNLLLNKATNYDMRFSTGIVEGTGMSINETGNIITFYEEGSYRFEICGEAAPFSNVEVKLVYFSEKFPPDVRVFSEIKIPKEEEKLLLRGIPTILPLQQGQSIIPRLIPTPDESIVLLGGTRLLIHRVA